jgi:hypothetical protein
LSFTANRLYHYACRQRKHLLIKVRFVLTFSNVNVLIGRAFVESLRPSFDGFLQRLVRTPVLNGSELMAIFLTSPEEIRENFIPDMLNPWKSMKKVSVCKKKIIYATCLCYHSYFVELFVSCPLHACTFSFCVDDVSTRQVVVCDHD